MASKEDTLRPDELLAQLGWVRALTRNLVADPEVRDDVLQQVCLMALQQAPSTARTGPRLRAWLATVTRTLVWSTARADSRRVRREQAAAQPEVLPSTDDIVARREALRTLVDAVTTLEEPYFSVIVERYFDGKSVAEIAQRRGISPDAVRQRLSRARQRLRERLQSLLADDGTGWLSAGLPLAPAITSLKSAPARSFLTRFGGVFVAKSTGVGGAAKILVGLAIVVGLFLGAWYSLHESHPVTSPTSSLGRDSASRESMNGSTHLPVATPTLAPLPAGPAAPGDGEPSSAARGVASYPPGIKIYTVTGRVVDERGVPWVGALVRAVLDGPTGSLLGVKTYSYEIERNSLQTTTTDAQGRFSLSNPWVSGPMGSRGIGLQDEPALIVEADGMALHVFPLSNHDGQDLDFGDLVVSMKAATIVARLIDDTGAPIEGVHAGIFSGGGDSRAKGKPGFPDYLEFNIMGLARGRSDAAGRLEISGLWPSACEVSFRDGSHVRKTVRQVTVGPGETTDLGDVMLERGGHIAGVIRDGQGAAIPGAEVWAWQSMSVYTLAGDPQPEDWVNADPLAGVIDSLHEARAWHSDRSPVTSDAEGRFDRTGLSAKMLDVFAEAAGYEPMRVADTPLNSAQLQIVLAPEKNLDVLVIDDATDVPVEGTALKAFRCSKALRYSHRPLEAERRVTTSLRPGAFVVHTIGSQGTRLIASAPGYATQSSIVTAPDSGEPVPVTLRLHPACLVKGRVEDESGMPIEAAVVSLRPEGPEGVVDQHGRLEPNDGHRPETRSAADGGFHFDSLESGRLILAARATGFRDFTSAPLDLEPGVVLSVPPVILHRACGITGTVHRADGTPAGGLHLWVPTPSGTSSIGNVLGDIAGVTYAGDFAITDLMPGTFSVNVGEWPGVVSHPYLDVEVTLAEGETRVLDLVLPRLPTVRGRVTSGGIGVASTRVRATEDPGESRGVTAGASQDCGEDGGFVLQLKQEGSYRVYAERIDGGSSIPVTVKAVWGLDLPLDFELGTASIAGRVVDATDGTSPANMEVRLMREGEPACDWIAAAASGSFDIHPLLAGTYVIQARSGAYPLTSAVSDLHLYDGQRLQDVVVPVYRGAVIDGVVLDIHGQPDGAWVYLVKPGNPPTAEQHGAPEGHLHIEGISPGSYRLVVAGIGYADALADPHSVSDIQASEDASTEIVLKAGEHRQVTLQKLR